MIINTHQAEPELVDMCQDCVLWNLCKLDFNMINNAKKIIVQECDNWKREK